MKKKTQTEMKKKQAKKKVGEVKKFDPFKLDNTEYARLVKVSTNTDFEDADAQDRATEAGFAMTDAHPLLEDAVVQRFVEEVRKLQNNLYVRRYPEGGVHDDAYYCFEEGWILRPEVVAKIIRDYIRAHPELL